jgi:hypothetical protein
VWDEHKQREVAPMFGAKTASGEDAAKNEGKLTRTARQERAKQWPVPRWKRGDLRG